MKTLLIVSLLFSVVAHSEPLDYSQSVQESDLANSTEVASDDEVVLVYQEGELEQLLAPIALYPDTLLSHVLIAATYPLEVIEAYRFKQENESLTSEEIIEKSEEKDWDPSVKALLPFASVLKKLHDDLDWTQRLGSAFLHSEKQVMVSIQTLRSQADDAGNLTAMDNVDVTYEKEKIVILPREKEIVYVPYYDTRIVYGHWRWKYYPPVHWHHPGHYYSYYNPYYWRSGVYISTAFYFSAIHWHNHYVAVDYRFHDYHRGHHHNKHHHDKYYGGKKHHIVKSGYAKRWSHNPHHRKGVAYRKNGVKSRHYSGYSKSHLKTNKHVMTSNKHNLNKRRVLNTNKYTSKSQNKSYTSLSAAKKNTIRSQEVKSYAKANNKTVVTHKSNYKKTVNKVKKTHSHYGNKQKNRAYALEKEPSKNRTYASSHKSSSAQKTYTAYNGSKQNSAYSKPTSSYNKAKPSNYSAPKTTTYASNTKSSKSYKNSNTKSYSSKSSSSSRSKSYSQSRGSTSKGHRSSKSSGGARKHR